MATYVLSFKVIVAKCFIYLGLSYRLILNWNPKLHALYVKIVTVTS